MIHKLGGIAGNNHSGPVVQGFDVSADRSGQASAGRCHHRRL